MSQEKTKDMVKYFYRASAADFMKIPGGPVAYWANPILRTVFGKYPKLSDLAHVKQGLATADNDRFLRLWFEVSAKRMALSCDSREESAQLNARWFPHSKGGEFRKWYGNRVWLVNWENDGEELLAFRPRSVIRSPDRYFEPCLSWTLISSSSTAFRYEPTGNIIGHKGPGVFCEQDLKVLAAFLNSKVALYILSIIAPTIGFEVGQISLLPIVPVRAEADRLIDITAEDWDAYKVSWDFASSPLLSDDQAKTIEHQYRNLRAGWEETILEVQRLEEENNENFICAYGLEDELTPNVSLEEVTLSCNPHYRYGGDRSTEELENILQCDTLAEFLSYTIGCIMGRYSMDKPGLILASPGETLQDYLHQISEPQFAPDDDAILPLTDQEWFADDATNRFCEFVRVVWGDEGIEENLDFVAESLCLHAINPKRGESALDTIRRYLSTQFFKDHLRTYKKRPIYWLFSSGKHKAFECLVYLHRYNEGTLARMRTEYVIPLSAKLNAYAEKLEQDKDASTSTAETKRLEKEISTLYKQQTELAEFDEKLRHHADQRISLDLDDGVKVNYGRFGDLLAEVKAVTGQK